LARAGLIAFLYFVVVGLSLKFILQPEGIVVIWPASGLLLAALLLTPRRAWPMTLAGVFLAEVMATLAAGLTPMVGLGFALANCAEGALAAWLLIRFVGQPITFTHPKQVLGLLGLAAGLGNGLTALLGAAAVSAGVGAPFGEAWLMVWISHGVGTLVVAPAVLVWASDPSILKRLTRRPLKGIFDQAGEAVVLLIALVVATRFAFGSQSGADFHVPFHIFPLLLWAAFRFGVHGAATGALVVSLAAVWNTSQSLGPFAAPALSSRGEAL
jgi:integral membrane sensor domain MASE1